MHELGTADSIVTSSLTAVECARGLARARALGRITAGDEADVGFIHGVHRQPVGRRDAIFMDTSQRRSRVHNHDPVSSMLLGLRTVIYAAPELDRAKAWYSALLGSAPYFDERFYVGFNVGGYELGLDPNAVTAPGPGGAIAYWGVTNLDAAMTHALAAGAILVTPAQDVGGEIRVATIADPAGNHIGLIENPNFQLAVDTSHA